MIVNKADATQEIERLVQRIKQLEQQVLSASSCSYCPVLETKLAQAHESLHFANGVAELAMKHRNEAEAVIEQIRNLVTTDHKSKGAFIRRVQACLPVDPFINNAQEEARDE